MSQIIFADRGNLYLQIPPVFIPYGNRISRVHVQFRRHFLCQNGAAVIKRILFIRYSVPEDNKVRKIFQICRHIQINIIPVPSVPYINGCQHSFRQACHISVCFKFCFNPGPLLICHAFFQDDIAVIKLNLPILDIHDRENRVLQPKSHQHQRHAAANSENRHKQTLFISHQISHAGFPGKIQPLPDKSDPFQHDSLSLFRRGRAHQFGSLRPQLPVACQKCGKERAGQRGGSGPRAIDQIVGKPDLMHMLKHDPVSIDDNIRKYFLTEQDAQQTSRNRCQKGIAQIFARNGMPFIPQCLKSTDLGSLLLHHSCHSCQADQRRHKKEYGRKYLADRAHPVRVFSVSAVLRKIGTVIDIPLRFLQILNLLFRIGQFLFRIFNLLFSVRDLLLSLCLTFIVLFPAVCDFLLCIGQLRLRVSQLPFSGLNLIPSCVNLCLTGLQLCLRVFDLRLRPGNSLFSLLNFLIEGIHCANSNRIRPAAGRKSVVLFLGRIQFINLTVECVNTGIQFLFSPVQLFLSFCKLRSG